MQEPALILFPSRACRPLASLALLLSLASAASAQVLDPRPLWNFADPAQSEARFREALAGPVSADDRLVLNTQVARSLGLRLQFAQARQMLDGWRADRDAASPQAAAHWHLEWGRSWCSAAHSAAEMDARAKAEARAAFLRATELARSAGADELAVDALHMMAFVDTAPADARQWTGQALALALSSPRPAARRWEASLRNNLGVAWMDEGQAAAALVQFEAALAARRAAGAPAAQVRGAEWMQAWALRHLGRHAEALRIQQRLAEENEREGSPDIEVFDELALLHTALGQPEAAAQAQARVQKLRGLNSK